jgi:ATP-dependent RNA helicase SUPV3L1/SUV3
VAAAKSDAFKLARNGAVLWRDEEIARLLPAEDALKPSVELLIDEHLSGPDKEKVQARLETWVSEIIAERLKPLVETAGAQDIAGLARGIAFRMSENFGMLKRENVAEEVRTLDQQARAQLRKYGVRFGAFNIYLPLLLKPAAAELTLILWALKHAGASGLALDSLPEPPRPGLTSVPANPAVPEAFYRAAGYHVCGPRAVRVDMLERLADLIRPLLAWRADPNAPATPPKGSSGAGGFTVIPEMMSILGCSSDELGEVLKALGFRCERKLVTKPATPPQVSAQAAASGDAAEHAEPQVAGAPGEQEAASGAADGGAASSGAEQHAQQPTVAVEQAVSGGESGSTEAPPTPEQVPMTAPGQASAAQDDAATAQEYQEVWFPRRRQHGDRRHRHRGTGDARKGKPADPAAAAPPQHVRSNGRPRWKQGERRKGGDQRRREDRPRHEAPLVAAPPRKATIDPDSPFAALSALKSELEKRAKEQGTT